MLTQLQARWMRTAEKLGGVSPFRHPFADLFASKSHCYCSDTLSEARSITGVGDWVKQNLGNAIAAAVALFVGTVQGLVVQTLLVGNPQTLQSAARRLWPLYLRAIGVRQP